MNRKTRIAALLAAAGLAPLLTACEGTTQNGKGPTEINIATSIDALAKAPQLDQNGAGNFAPGDRFALNIAADGFESVPEIPAAVDGIHRYEGERDIRFFP